MNRRVVSSPSIASQVASAADDFLEQLGRGEEPCVEDIARRYPQIASVLPDVLQTLEAMRKVSADCERESVDSPLDRPVLSDFRLIREIGRGGMGTVYEAQQISTGRLVALKLLHRTTNTDSRFVARFQIEARIASSLRHPHIVPVFLVGCDHGVHFYAMRLITGFSLAEILRQKSCKSDRITAGREISIDVMRPMEAARLAVQAAEALDHAHSAGVLHRDIKPANLLRDEGGDLWITDFGLASFQGGIDLTQTGDLLGTVRYMSPEQAAGARVLDHRTDIYSLGVTLYELLTGCPAFGGADRNEILGRIANEEPLPPKKLNNAIPMDLDTIVRKAMAKEPERRYSSARALADDLARFLDAQPIKSRRPHVTEELVWWSRRHARAIAVGALILLIATGASITGAAVLWHERNQTQIALRNATKARDAEREALRFTFAASDQITNRALLLIAAPASGVSTPERARDREFCRKALEYYELISSRYALDHEMRGIVAAALHRVGFARTVLEEQGAGDALERACKIYEKMIGDEPRSRENRTELALTYGDIVVFLRKLSDQKGLTNALRRLTALRRELAVDHPNDADNLVSLAYHQIDFIEQLDLSRQAEEANEARRWLRTASLKIVGARPGDHRLRNNIAWIIGSPAETSVKDASLAAKLAAEAVSLESANGTYWNTLGIAQFRAGDYPNAITALETAAKLKGGDGYDWLFLAMAWWRLGQFDQARTWYSRSLAWTKSSAPGNPELIRFGSEAKHLIK